MESLKNITLIFSDADEASIPASYIRYAKIDNISDVIELDTTTGQLHNSKKAKIQLQLDGDYVSFTKTRDNYQNLSEDASILNRIRQFPDIVAVSLNSKSDDNSTTKSEIIKPYWKSSKVVETANMYQHTKFDKINNILTVVLGSIRTRI
jgi:hypothetical protein